MCFVLLFVGVFGGFVLFCLFVTSCTGETALRNKESMRDRRQN